MLLMFLGFLDPCGQNETYHTSNETMGQWTKLVVLMNSTFKEWLVWQCFTSTMIWQICRACRWSAKNKKRKGKRKRSSLNKLLSTMAALFLSLWRLCGLQYVSCFAKTNVNSIKTVLRRRRSEEWQWRWRKNKQSEINQSTDCKLMMKKTSLLG